MNLLRGLERCEGSAPHNDLCTTFINILHCTHSHNGSRYSCCRRECIWVNERECVCVCVYILSVAEMLQRHTTTLLYYLMQWGLYGRGSWSSVRDGAGSCWFSSNIAVGECIITLAIHHGAEYNLPSNAGWLIELFYQRDGWKLGFMWGERDREPQISYEEREREKAWEGGVAGEEGGLQFERQRTHSRNCIL